ncbi:putative lipase [Venturia nashicola]|uniref:Putative lipase n=1 Tax=Venturia nashicola TaxID=86259 RepID=A0A4Z1PBA4_9PEZI|nr:putative lipase [Venturia nashicola]TLD37763.1 putative lipase [Venturia nashicola]
MSFMNRLLLAFLSLSTSFAIPHNSSAADAQRADTVVEVNTRYLLSQLQEDDQPKLARNSMKLGELPTITLPYGRFRATKYVEEIDVFVFKNVRYGAPPTGPARFLPPQPPTVNQTVSDGSYGPQCLQSLAIQQIPEIDLAGILGLGDRPGLGTYLIDSLKPIISRLSETGSVDELVSFIRPLLGPGGPLSAFPGTIGDLIEGLSGVMGLGSSEDCLFLDVYVPGKAMRKQTGPLPVLHWFHGGAHVLGSKEGMYDGFSMIEKSGGNMVVVSSNYRLGAWGFLAGRTAEGANATNLGLYDQHAALQWNQDFIALFGGDKSRVTAAGESAGAGSLLHHLVAFGGTEDPLFHRAMIQSPVFQPIVDRDGLGEAVFRKFETQAGCTNQGFACLAAISTERFQSASDAIVKQAPPGTFSFGPTSDGHLIRQTPHVEMSTGNFWKGLESVMLSHTSDEVTMFASSKITTQRSLDDFQRKLLPTAPALQNAVEKHFNKLSTVKQRLFDFMQGTIFACNIRFLSQAYADRNFVYQYAKGRGSHGSDILPMFYSRHSPLTALAGTINSDVIKMAEKLQPYLAAYIVTGDPNTREHGGKPPFLIEKIKDSSLEYLAPVLSFDDVNEVILDPHARLGACEFWRDVEAAGTNLLGYAPPGAVARTTIPTDQGDPSRFYFRKG